MSLQPIFSFNNLILTNGNMADNLTSSVQDISEVCGFCVQANWSAGSTPVGTLNIQASLDNVNFTTVASVAVSGNSGSNLVNVNVAHYRYVQCTYTATSGSGTLNVYIAGKIIS